jgi:hypothetical protein
MAAVQNEPPFGRACSQVSSVGASLAALRPIVSGDARDKRSGEQRTDAWNAIEALARLIGAVPCHDHSIKI